MKQIYNHYVNERIEVMNSTKSKLEDIFGDVVLKDSISPEQITKLNIFFSKNNVKINLNIKIKFFIPRKKTNTLTQPSDPPEFSDF